MFDFLRRNRLPAGPHEFGAEIEIARSAAEVFPLLDIADARYAKRQLGERVEQVAGWPDRYEMVLAAAPDLVFLMDITERQPGKVIAFASRIEPQVGRLAHSTERYEVSDLGPELCRVELAMTVMFQSELSMRAFSEESAMLSLSLYNALAKIKVHAEEGLDALRVANGQIVVGMDDLNCG